MRSTDLNAVTEAVKAVPPLTVGGLTVWGVSWSEFVRQLEYKAQWYGRTLIGIDRGYPSSKRCSDCGHTVSKLPLSVREWVCPECGTIHDRDINAARNVLAAGLAVSAHGEAVSPVCI